MQGGRQASTTTTSARTAKTYGARLTHWSEGQAADETQENIKRRQNHKAKKRGAGRPAEGAKGSNESTRVMSTF